MCSKITSIQKEFKEHNGIVLWGTCNVFYVLPKSHYVKCMKSKDVNDDVMKYAVECRIKGKRQNVDEENEKYNTFLTAGDEVLYLVFSRSEISDKNPMGLITKRLKRKNIIARKKYNILYPIAVNVDVLGIILSFDEPIFRPRFADRLLWLAFEQNIQTFIVVNKIDLALRVKTEKYRKAYDAFNSRIQSFRDIGVMVFAISLRRHCNDLDTIRELCHGKRTALLGQSGVGKSSLINALIPHANRSVGHVSKKYNRGRHVTTRPDIICGLGYAIVDTPGIRDLHPAYITKNTIEIGYPDISVFTEKCTMIHCTHEHENGCAVRKEIGGKIHPDRYESYIRLLHEVTELEKNKWYRKKR